MRRLSVVIVLVAVFSFALTFANGVAQLAWTALVRSPLFAEIELASGPTRIVASPLGIALGALAIIAGVYASRRAAR